MRPLLTGVSGAVVVGCLVVLVVAAPVWAGQDASKRTIRWHTCGSGSPRGLQCGELSVPLDYGSPRGARIKLGFNRLRASDRAHRVGSLILNPGGPGGAGSEVVAVEAAGKRLWDPALHRRFDLIGMDPRGIGTSTPIRCDPAIINEPVSVFPSTPAEFGQLEAHARAFGQSCLQRTGPLLGHVDTRSAARDMEALRRALGDGKLNFLGLSYGAELGAQYAELYPTRIRAMALDGALEHSISATRQFVDATMAYEDTFNRFVTWCARSASCPLHGRDVAALFDGLVQRADQQPIAAPACAMAPCRMTVTGGDIRLNSETSLLVKDGIPALGLPGWKDFAAALARAEQGDASAFSSGLARSPGDGSLAGLAVYCVDFGRVSGYGEFAFKTLLARTLAPHTQGASEAWPLLGGCLHWPVPVANPPHRARIRGAPRILLANATHDPSTPYLWAQGLLSQIPSAVLLTREGDGHTSSWLLGRSRTRDAIVRYLITRRTPPRGTVYPD